MASDFPRPSGRTRRSLTGRPIPRRRLPPGLLRPAPAPKSNGMRWATRLLFAFAVLVALVTVSGAGAAFTAYNGLTSSLTPRLDAIENRTSFQTTRIYDRKGRLLYEMFGAGKRTHVPLDNISPLLIKATISIEDKTFYTNQGVDYEGIVKAFGRSLEAGEETGGASTITQQLIKGVVLTDEERAPEKRYERKATEIVLARELTQRYSKDKILDLYLNEIYYGNLAYGVEAASNVYFNKSAKNLTLPEAGLLAGLPQSPSYYDPMNYLEGDTLKGVTLGEGWVSADYPLPKDLPVPKIRQIAVISQMVDEGYISEPQGRAAIAQDLRFQPQEVPLNAPHFVFYVRKLLEEQYGQEFANRGLSVYTSIDLDMQNMVQREAHDRIKELQERNIFNAAVVVMQPNTGEILSMVGSIDYNQSIPSATPGEEGNVLDGQVNVAVRERQPGSALKPFTYLSAMEQGADPTTIWWDVPTEFVGGGAKYAPLNYNGKWNGPVRMRTALANSLNMPAVKALKFAGIDNTINLLHRIGITGLRRGADVYGLSLTLGGGEVTPLDLTTAYNTVASGGYYYPPVAITRIVDGEGQTVFQYQPVAHQDTPDPAAVTEEQRMPGMQVLRPEHVAIISDMMSDDRARRPVWGLNSKLKLSRPAAVKTGTSNDWRDAWAVGFTPYATVGVWTGNNNNEATAKVESITGGGAIWHNVMETLFANPEFMAILSEPYNGPPPIDFDYSTTAKEQKICPLPGPFGEYSTELFAPDMLKKASKGGLGCNEFTSITVARIGAAPAKDSPDGTPVPADTSRGRYCVPTAGMNVPADRLTKVYSWKLPPRDPNEKVTYTWSGGSATDASNVPACSASMFAPPTPTPEPAPLLGEGDIIMPDLRKLGENQAKELLAALGAQGQIVVQYQTRQQIPDVFDQYVPYSVVSTLPRAGQVVRPGDLIILGVRAPEDQPVAQPTAVPQEAPPQPTAVPQEAQPEPTAVP